jgi:uncharacterized protein YcaQ
VKEEDVRRVLARIRKLGPLTIRDIDDEVLVEKDHLWASRKPSKRALQLAFYRGILTVSERTGMLKTYELMNRHFGWKRLPRAASEREIVEFRLDRALRSQGVVSVDSACYLDPGAKPAMRRLIEARVGCQELVPVAIEGLEKVGHWARPEELEGLETPAPDGDELVHFLSPFDPLMNQRKRVEQFFGYLHRFEAYVPVEKRVFGYFALPVIAGDEVVAAIDLKTDRERKQLLVQKWTWIASRGRRRLRQRIDESLHRFERFQLAS